MGLAKSGGGYQVADGNITEVTIFGRAQVAVIVAAYALTVVDLASGIVAATSSGSYSITTPTGVALDAVLTNARVGSSFNLSICHSTAINVLTLVGGAGVSVVGLATVTGIASGLFTFRKTGDGTWSVYRIA